METSTAILVDGGFFLKRLPIIYPGVDRHDPSAVANTFYTMAMGHVEGRFLYRILFYDCSPSELKGSHNPISKKYVNFKKENWVKFRLDFHKELKRRRKIALRLGKLKDNKRWEIVHNKTYQLLNGKIEAGDLSEHDVVYSMEQKGVDMKIGLDIASLALKKMVNQIILISGDSDFVPAAKMARREGIDFILDPLWNHIKPELFEHIDGLKSVAPKPRPKTRKPK